MDSVNCNKGSTTAVEDENPTLFFLEEDVSELQINPSDMYLAEEEFDVIRSIN